MRFHRVALGFARRGRRDDPAATRLAAELPSAAGKLAEKYPSVWQAYATILHGDGVGLLGPAMGELEGAQLW